MSGFNPSQRTGAYGLLNLRLDIAQYRRHRMSIWRCS